MSIVSAWLTFDVSWCHRYLVATTTIWSGASYIYATDAVRILKVGGKKK